MSHMNTGGAAKTDSASEETSGITETNLSPVEKLDAQAEEVYGLLKKGEEVPEDTDPAVLLIAREKKKARDTQSAYTKTRQELAEAKAAEETLKSFALNATPLRLSEEQVSELEELKLDDPDAWRTKLNQYEAEAKQKRETKIADSIKAKSAEAIEQTRMEQLKEFSSTTGLVLTDDIIKNDIPPRLTNKLKNNEIDFGEFLTEVGKFLGAEKVIDGADKSKDKDASALFRGTTGGGSPDTATEDADFITQYANGDLEL